MRLQICAEIEGLFLLKGEIIAKLYPYEFALYEKDEKRFISITKPIKDYMKYAPKLYVKDGITHIETTKHEIYKDMEEWLYYIEAMGAFNFEVSKIHVDELEVNWIYETDDEKGQIPITSLKRNKQERKAEKYVANSNLSNLVVFRRMLPEAHIPFSYYRQAKAFFDDSNYYFAFINYFMMLEFCFAEGNFHKQKMTGSFLKSNLLKLCVLSAISMIKEKDNNIGNYYKWLLDECKTRQKDVNFEGIVYVLIEYRDKLRPLAFITSLICFLLCGYIQIYCSSSEESKNKLMQERISKLEEELYNNSPK